MNENPNATNEIRSYRVNSSGTVTQIGAYSTGHPGSNASFISSGRAALAGPFDMAHTATHLYALNLGDKTISAFTVSAVSGTLTLQETTPSLNATAIAVNPAGTVLYAGGADNLNSANTLSSYLIAPNGTIKPVPVAAVPASVDGLRVSPDGTEVAAAYPQSGSAPTDVPSIQLWTTDSQGHLSQMSVTNETCPTDVRFGMQSSTLYSAACTAGGTNAYTVSGSGQLTNTDSVTGTATQTFAVGPDGVVYFETSNYGIEGAHVSQTGQFSLGPTTPYPSNQTITSMIVSPDNSQLFVSSFSTSTVDDYAIGTSGTMTHVASISVMAGLPTLLAISAACPGDPEPSGATCFDSQNAEVTVDPGSLTITTPYTPSNPFVMAPLALNASATLLTSSTAFPAAGDPSITVHSSLSGNPNWTVTVTDTDLTCSGGPCLTVVSGEFQSINGENLGLTAGSTIGAVPSATFPGIVNFTDNSAAAGVPPGDPGSGGLKHGPHTFASSGGGGDGTVQLHGQLTLNAPTGTEAGSYTGAITFTVG